jgi:CheY-like chemotaxis protein
MKTKIYVLEGDLSISFALNTILEDAGYEVFLSHRGRPVVSNDFGEIDIFLIDNALPDVDGIDVCRRVRAHQPTKASADCNNVDKYEDGFQGVKGRRDRFPGKAFRHSSTLSRAFKMRQQTIATSLMQADRHIENYDTWTG